MVNSYEHAHAASPQSHPCPICGGHDGLGRGQGVRCFGYYDRSGSYARCTREEHAGSLPQNRDGTYSHRLHGQLPLRPDPRRCPGPGGQSPPRRRPSILRRRAEQRFRSYFTLAAFLRRRYGDGTAVRSWIYRDAAGDEAFRVLRIDYRAPDGSAAKSYRPCHQAADGSWLLSRPAVPAAALQPAGHPRRPAGGDHRRARRREMHRHRRRPRPAARHDQCPRCQGPAAHRLVAAGRPIRRHPPRRRRRRRRTTPPKSPPCWPPSIPPPASRSSPCPAWPTARTSSNSSRPAARPAAATPTSSPSCMP